MLPNGRGAEVAPRTLLGRLRAAVRARHYSPHTEESYVGWVKRFVVFHGRRHPDQLGEAEVRAFLEHLAERVRVSASTQNQAVAALLFLYEAVLGRRLAASAARVFELAGEGRGLSPWGDPGAGWEGGSGPGRAVAGAGAGTAGGSSRALAGASRARRGAWGWPGGLARRVRAQGGGLRDGVGMAVGISGAADPAGWWLRGGAAASSARVCHSACRAGCGTQCGDRQARD